VIKEGKHDLKDTALGIKYKEMLIKLNLLRPTDQPTNRPTDRDRFGQFNGWAGCGCIVCMNCSSTPSLDRDE